MWMWCMERLRGGGWGVPVGNNGSRAGGGVLATALREVALWARERAALESYAAVKSKQATKLQWRDRGRTEQ